MPLTLAAASVIGAGTSLIGGLLGSAGQRAANASRSLANKWPFRNA